ncbi:Hypothetical protein PMN2A_2084 [Prochlorococcus marinus str. NATL2A]|uniref:Uncharacterized protein n=1 Tax=Prochlorococcus marinus (strain NATL2A) TaxID=59920 RepID=A7MDS1_PROMT|nr:Hypothetical protein PMN2A_2084 [Prochlorococcus marinus str. NATL2A]
MLFLETSRIKTSIWNYCKFLIKFQFRIDVYLLFIRASRKEFMDKFFDLCKDAQEEIPSNVIAEILRDYAESLD